jgi:molybdopterin-guanine dinucleotide biosynthesis protein B
MPVIGVVGWKNSGKTTLVEALVAEFVRRGLRVATVKHTHHSFDIDHEGKDSHRHHMAGASQVIVSSRKRWAMITETPDMAEPSLETLVSHLAPCDLVIAEGFKTGLHPRIEVVRAIGIDGRIADTDPGILAIATPDPALAGRHLALPLDDVPGIADFITQALWVKPSLGSCNTGRQQTADA